MGLPLAARLGSPAVRTGLFYATLFTSGAVSNPFLPIWLSERGIGTAEIGVINAAPIFAMIVINLIVGRLADRASDWRTVIVIGSILAAIPPIFLLFMDSYVAVIILWTLVIVPFQAIAPVVDAAAYRMARRTGMDFGAIRVWGTIGFVVVTLLAGVVLDRLGPQAFIPLLIAVSVIRALMSLGLPLFRAPDEYMRPMHPIDAPINPLIAIRLGQMWRPWFLLTLIGASLLHGSHMMQMGFGALIWAEEGIPGWVIGILWAVAPTAEILAMVFFERITKRFAARHLILLGCIAGAIRWWGFALEPDIWVLVLLQTLHLATVGLTFLGITNFIANWTSEDIAAEAQSFFVMIRQVITVVALLGFGFLAGSLGAGAFYVASIMSGVGAVMVLASLFIMNPKKEATT
ncbi:MFS transporter [Devosia lacusdianchii]|uniref:MFS transporter n=1 Tax=Devosia lacusdianchii TaxID=2917991 RepID=UPI001F064BB3|nr:MFS transporter [Devosia sp. JXJ CY 41]